MTINCHKGHGEMAGERRFKDKKGDDQVSLYCKRCVALARAQVRLELTRARIARGHLPQRKTA